MKIIRKLIGLLCLLQAVGAVWLYCYLWIHHIIPLGHEHTWTQIPFLVTQVVLIIVHFMVAMEGSYWAFMKGK